MLRFGFQRFAHIALFGFISSVAAFACGGDDDTGLVRATGGSAGVGGSRGATRGCGDLLACCLSLEAADDKQACQATAAALADASDGAAQCESALEGYEANGFCRASAGGASGGPGGSTASGGKAGGGGAVGKGGAAGHAGADGGASGQGGAAAGGQGGKPAGAGGSAATGGSAAAGGGQAGLGGSSGAAGTTIGTAGMGMGGGGNGGAAPALTFDDACASWAQALCAKADACGGSMKGRFTDANDCLARMATLDCKLRFATDAAASWTPPQIAACGAAWSVATCTDLLLDDPAACAGHLGSRALKQGCTNSSECASGFCSSAWRIFPEHETSCGLCMERSPVDDPSAGCVEDGDCALGTRCDGDGGCVALGVAGQSCAELPCAKGYGCSPGDNPTCQPQRRKGDPCAVDAQCSERLGLACVAGTCGERVVAIGGTCPNQGPATCAADGACTTKDGVRQCAPPEADGAACDTGPFGLDAGNCRYPAICVNHTCKAAYHCLP